VKRERALVLVAVAGNGIALGVAVGALLARRRSRRGCVRPVAAERGTTAPRVAAAESAVVPLPVVPEPDAAVLSTAAEPDATALPAVPEPDATAPPVAPAEPLPPSQPSDEPSTSAPGFLNAGLLYAEVGLWQQAIAYFNRALVLAPDYVPALHNRALAFARSGDLAAALADYNRAALLAPNDAEVLNGRGALLAALGERQRARDDFLRAAACEAAGPEPLINLGLLLLDEGEAGEALTRFDLAAQRAPHEAWAHYGRAVALAVLGRLDEARPALDQALRLEPALAGEAVRNRHLAALWPNAENS